MIGLSELAAGATEPRTLGQDRPGDKSCDGSRMNLDSPAVRLDGELRPNGTGAGPMQICTSCNGTYSPGAGARIDAAAAAGRVRESAAAEAANPLINRGADSVNISTAARELSDRLPVAKIRTELVEQIRGEIAAGTYEADDGKLDVATDQLLGRLNITG